MISGKQKCRILKEIRRKIAEANNIDLVQNDCSHKGDCRGTCPKCDSELLYLEKQLHARALAGKSIVIAGISAASLCFSVPVNSSMRTSVQIQTEVTQDTNDNSHEDSIKVKSTVIGKYISGDDSVATENLVGAAVINSSSRKAVPTDHYGNFELDARKGDILEISYVGYKTKTIHVGEVTIPAPIILEEADMILLGETSDTLPQCPDGALDLFIRDEHGMPVDYNDVIIYVARMDNNNTSYYERVCPTYLDENNPFRFYWNRVIAFRDETGKPLNEVDIRIEVDGYEDPDIIKLKRPVKYYKTNVELKTLKK